MRIDPKTAGIISAGSFFFLLIFGLGWPGPGAWLLVFSLLFIAAAAGAWWLDGAMVTTTGGGAVVAAQGASPFGRGRSGGRGAGRTGDSKLLSLGLPGPDRSGRWVLPDKVHVTIVAGLIGALALFIFIGGALGGGGTDAPAAVPALQPNPALDFAQPVAPAPPSTLTGSATTPTAEEPAPIQLEPPATTRPEPARPLEASGAATTPAETTVHEVVAGDTIYDLAITYDTSIDAIMNANGITQLDTIRVGERLVIPVGGS